MFKNAVLCSLLGTLAGTIYGGNFSIQAGAFKTENEAQVQKNKLSLLTTETINIRPEENDQKGLLYKILIGDFSSRNDAEENLISLKKSGINGYIRPSTNLSANSVRNLLKSSSGDYFSTQPVEIGRFEIKKLTNTEIKSLRTTALSGPTTSPETLARFTDYIDKLPDNQPGKSSEILILANRSFSGKNAYKQENTDLSKPKELLLKIANREIDSTEAQRIDAMRKVAHIEHYYSRDYENSLNAYKQILSELQSPKDDAIIVKTQMEIAAASYELAKISGFSKAELEDIITPLWIKSTQIQENYLTTNTITAQQTRVYSGRIGLMLSEIMLDQKEWDNSREICDSLITTYSDFKECQGILAEIYCHLAIIGLESKNKDLCYSSIESAISISETTGKVWGDPIRDTLWKAYTWKAVAYYRFNEPRAKKLKLKAEMEKRFSGHPGLKNFFGGKK